MMAEALDDDDEIFVYMGGDQRVPDRVRRARIHVSVKIVRARSFYCRRQLIYVEFHDGVEIIEEEAFLNCPLRSIKLLGVKIIKTRAFAHCSKICDVRFGVRLETIECRAFNGNHSLRKISMPTVRTVGSYAFANCNKLLDVEFGEALRTLEDDAFHPCWRLKRIVLPLKEDVIRDIRFYECPKLSTVDLVGGIHQTVASLHMDSWRYELNNEIDRINLILPVTDDRWMTPAIRRWMRRVTRQLDHYKNEHKALLKEASTLLDLALWKANLAGNDEDEVGKEGERQRERNEMRVTSGADIVIKNVLPFLALK